jgi:hypothetical protein
MPVARFSLSYSGALSDQNEIDFYDVGQALIGFQRSLAITVHAILNDEVITQAPSLKGAQLLVLPFESGSWKVTTVLIASIAAAAHAPKDTPLGNLVSSAYDYVISESLGFHVDYNKTLGQQYDEVYPKGSSRRSPLRSRLDSVIEKVDTAIINMHRPIVHSETAIQASISAAVGEIETLFDAKLNRETYDFIDYTQRTDLPENLSGRVSSYNINTFKGRIFVDSEGRPIHFELSEGARDRGSVAVITNSSVENAQSRRGDKGTIGFSALRNLSRSGQLKGFYILSVTAGVRSII